MCRAWGSVPDRTHALVWICVRFILALALSAVTSAPHAAPGLTQYAHTDEDQPAPQLLESQRCKCHARASTHTCRHTPPYLYLYYIFPLYPLPFVFAFFLSPPPVIFHSVCMLECVLLSCLCVCALVSVWVVGIQGCTVSLLLVEHFLFLIHLRDVWDTGIIGMLSDFLFAMITQNNKSEITSFIQSEEGDGGRIHFVSSSLTSGSFFF